MRRKLLIILTLCFLASLISCKKAPLNVGPIVCQTRELPDFNEVHINDNISVSLVRSDTCYIEITTGKNIIDNIITEVKDGKLTIGNTTTLDWIRPFDYELHTILYFKDITNLVFSSSGTLNNTNNYTGQLNPGDFYRFEIDGGSGDVELDINNCDDLRIVYQYGISRLNIHGKNNKNLVIYKRSYGLLDAKEYEAQYVSITSISVSDCYINASDYINAEINDLGDIYYKGEPDSISVTYGEYAKGRLIKL